MHRVIVAVVSTLALALVIAQLASNHPGQDFGGATFAAAAGLAALVLPAAALVEQAVGPRLQETFNLFTELPQSDTTTDVANLTPEDKSALQAKLALESEERKQGKAALLAMTTRLEGNLRWMNVGLVMALLAFPIAGVALLHPDSVIGGSHPRPWWPLRVEDVALGLGIALDVLSLMFFVPFTRLVLSSEGVRIVKKMLK